jgi:hypothetical protein
MKEHISLKVLGTSKNDRFVCQFFLCLRHSMPLFIDDCKF